MIKKKKVLGIIPARGGSKGIPRKNIFPFAGKPLIAYTIKAGLESKVIDKLIVSTDDKEIAEVAERYGASVPFLRPKKLAGDKSPMVPVVQQAISFLEKKEKVKYDYIVLLQPTSPLRVAEDIDKAVKVLRDTGADSVYSLIKIHEATHHPLKIKKILAEGRVKPYFKDETEGAQRQGLPPAYRRNGAIFAFTRDLIMSKNSIFGTPKSDIRAYIMPPERSVDTDSLYELYLAELIYKDIDKKSKKQSYA